MSKQDDIFKRSREALQKYLEGLTPEEKEAQRKEFFPPDNTPKGWVSIEDHLPMMKALDIMEGYTAYKVKDKDGEEFETRVSDHDIWYYIAKEAGITHWWNE